MKQLVALLLIASVALAAVNIDVQKAQEIVTPYVYQGEQIDIQPQKLTVSGADSYWVMEAKSLSQIQVMFPVDASSGLIVRSSSIKPVMKTHYLANFYATSNSISNFLDETLNFAQQQQADLDQKIRNFETNVEPFIPSGVTFTKKDSYKNVVKDTINKSAALRSTINTLKTKIGAVDDPTDVTATQSSFSTFFTQEISLLNALDTVTTASDAFHVEINGKINSGEIDTSFGNTMTISSSHSISTIQRRDSLTTNKNTIDSFYTSLDSKTDEYYVKLNNRVNQSQDEIQKRAIIEKLNNYSIKYDSLTSEGASLSSSYKSSSGFDADLLKLYNLLNVSYSYCSGTLTNCNRATTNYNQMNSLIANLDADVSGYTAGCTDGQTRSCSTGTQTCSNGAWGACSAPSSLNYTLISALVLVIIALLAYKYRDKFMKGGEKIEPKKDYLSYYKR